MSISKFFYLILFALTTTFYASAQINDQPIIKIAGLINAISDSLKKHYIFPDKADSISNYLHAKLESNAYYAKLLKDPSELALQIGKDIGSVCHNPHLRVQFDPGFNAQVAYNPTPEEKLQVKKYWKGRVEE